MKKIFLLFSVMMIVSGVARAQPDKTKYPEPEFSNEVYFLKLDSTVVRLEKNTSRMDTKMKLGGFGGGESGYIIDGDKSPVRLPSGSGLSFVYSTGASANKSSAQSDSVMKANGVDPSMTSDMMGSMSDPANTITLYNVESGKGVRKILMQKTPGMFGGKKNSSSDKYTFSVRKIRNGYWELVIDKTLPRGEYAFTVMGFGSVGMDGSIIVFSFAVE